MSQVINGLLALLLAASICFHLFFLYVRVCDDEISCIHSVIAVLFFHDDIRIQTRYIETALVHITQGDNRCLSKVTLNILVERPRKTEK